MDSPAIPAPRIASGRRVLLVSALVVVVLSVTAGWWMVTERPRPGAYLDAVALEGDFVVAVRHEQTSDRAFVELVGLGEGMRWQALVPGYAAPPGAPGIAASQTAITVRYVRDGRMQMFGFATLSAQKLGSILLGDGLPRRADGHRSATVATVGGGELSFELLEAPGNVRVHAVSLRDGVSRWHRDLPGSAIRAAWRTDDHLLLERADELTVLDAAGAVTSWPGRGACIVPGGAQDGADLAVLAASPDAVAAHRVAPGGRADAPTWSSPLQGGTLAGLCGRRGDRLVLGVDGADGAALWVVDRGAVTTVPLGPGRLATSGLPWMRASAPLAVPLAGALPRLVPVLVEGPDGTRVVGVDLDAGTIAWQGRPSPGLGGASLLEAGGRVLLRAGDVLVSLDPATGDARAVRVEATRPLAAHHVSGRSVWVVGDRGLVALDVDSLRPRGAWRTPPTASPADDALAGLGL